MTFSRKIACIALIGSLGFGAAASAQDVSAAVSARQGSMNILALNIGVLAGMARGNAEYDAETAQAAADNIATISMMDQRFYWPPGSDSDSFEGSRVLASAWEDFAGVAERSAAFGAAAEGIQAAAGNGLESMQAALGPLGASCGACHDDYRQPE